MFFIELYNRFIEIVLAPAHNKDMIWILAPLLATLLLMELYFDRYKGEELGWNTAFGNSLVLIFVSVDIIKFLHTNDMLSYVTIKSALAIAVILLGLSLTILSFFHSLPKELAFGLTSRLPINLITYLTVVIVYADIIIDVYTAIASVLFAVIAGVLLKLISLIVPESGEIPELENIEEEPKD